MTFEIVINNYQLGAMLKITPTEKIVERKRLDKSHTLIKYEGVSEREKQLINKVFGKS